MKLLSPSQLLKAMDRQGSGTGHIEFGCIDPTQYFMPEALTQLYHTPIYSELSDEHRLRYNQLFALRTSEQLMMLEECFIEQVLKQSYRKSDDGNIKALMECMKAMSWEETTHFDMFARLNRLAAPEIYAGSDYFFVKTSPLESVLLKTLPCIPGVGIFLLWLLMILEEFSTAISKKMIRENDSQFEANFVLAHKAHLIDESRHVHICGNLLVQSLENTSPFIKKINIKLLQRFMNDYMTPKRAGPRVIKQLVEEFPELSELKGEMCKHIRSQKQDKVIWEAIQNPKQMPVTHLLFECFPEFRFYDSSINTELL